MNSTRSDTPARRSSPAAEAGGGVQPRIIAAVHERRSEAEPSGLAASIVVGQLDAGTGGGSGNGGARGTYRMTATRHFSPAEHGAVRGFLKDAGVDLLIRFVPPEDALCRLSPMPEISGQDRAAVADALSLIAETELPAHLPWYRRAAGLVRLGVTRAAGGDPTVAATTSPVTAALLAGWNYRRGSTSSRPASESLEQALQGIPVLWTIEAVGLAGLLARPASPHAPDSVAWAASLDRSTGSACLVAITPAGPRARSFRLPGTDQSSATLAAAIEETLAGPDQSAPRVDLAASPAVVEISDGFVPQVAGERRDRSWIAQFGIPAAALETFADPDPAVRALFNLHALEPRERAPLLQRAVNWFASPYRAAIALAICVFVLLGARYGVAYARHQALAASVGDSTALETRLAGAERRMAFYSTLREKRWPMTKLIADIAGAAPVGIEIEMLEIAQGETVLIRGVAENNSAINALRQNLSTTGVFEQISIPNTGSTAGTVQFQLSARVRSDGPFVAAKPADDFVENPLGRRLYGDEWDPDDVVSLPARESRPAASREPSRSSSAPVRNLTGRTGSSESSRPNSAPAESAAPPPPLSDADIAKMDATAAMLEFAKRKAAANKATDAATKQRLLDESEKARRRMNEARAAGAGGRS